MNAFLTPARYMPVCPSLVPTSPEISFFFFASTSLAQQPSTVPSNPRSSGARKTATIKKRKARRFLAIASLFRRKKFGRLNNCCSSSSGGSGDGDDDERANLATAVGVNTNNCGGNGHLHGGFARSESRDLTNASRRSHGGSSLACWLWRTITRQRGRMGGSTGKRSPASSSGGGGGLSPLQAGATSSARNGEREAGATMAKTSNFQQQQQQQPSLPRMSARRPNSMSRNADSQRRSGYGGCGAVIGGCITQFYDAPAADEQENTLESSGGGAHRKVPSGEEAAEARARVQQLLRTSQVHMNKHSSMRSSSFAPGDSSGAGAAPSSTVTMVGTGAGAGH